MRKKWIALTLVALVAGLAAACGPKKPRTPATAQTGGDSVGTTRSQPPLPPRLPSAGRSEDVSAVEPGADIRTMTLEALNASAPLADIRFEYDSAALTPEAREVLGEHAKWLARYPSVTVLIEGHCDERGTVEYNLALGDRRSLAAFNYLGSLGIAGARMKTISYGKEFPLDPSHNESAWARNRRARFLITGK